MHDSMSMSSHACKNIMLLEVGATLVFIFHFGFVSTGFDAIYITLLTSVYLLEVFSHFLFLSHDFFHVGKRQVPKLLKHAQKRSCAGGTHRMRVDDAPMNTHSKTTHA